MAKQYRQVAQFTWNGSDKTQYYQLNDFLKTMTGAIMEIHYTHTTLGSDALVEYIKKGY